METIGHHTCKVDGGSDFVIKEVPFLAKYSISENKIPFLGSGYYYWDDNLEMSKYWGQSHYGNNYYIIESKLKLTGNHFLDLVGNRQHLRYFSDLLNRLEKHGYNRSSWTMGAVIEFFKKLNNLSIGIFPFIVIRAIDNSAKTQKFYKIFFVNNKDNFTNLNPRFVICIFKKSSEVILSSKIIYRS